VIIEELLEENPRRYFLLCRRLCVVGAGMREARKRLGRETRGTSAAALARGKKGVRLARGPGMRSPRGVTVETARQWFDAVVVVLLDRVAASPAATPAATTATAVDPAPPLAAGSAAPCDAPPPAWATSSGPSV